MSRHMMAGREVDVMHHQLHRRRDGGVHPSQEGEEGRQVTHLQHPIAKREYIKYVCGVDKLEQIS